MDVMSDSNRITNLCPECGGQIISIDNLGEVVCGQCGLIINERILDISHDGRRAFTRQEKEQRERTGAPISILLPDISLATVIDKRNIENPNLKRAVKWDSRITWEKRNIMIASAELKRICGNLNLPNHIKKEAMSLYKKAFKKKLLRGRSINSMVAASIYFACRDNKIPTTLHEILEQSSEKAKEVRRCYSILIKEFNLKVPSRDPLSLISRYIAELGLNAEIEILTTKLLKEFKSKFSTIGKDPKGICAGTIYLACKIKGKGLTQKEIASKIGVTEVTLRSRYKELAKSLSISV